jgi:hypothetical protein
MSKKAIFLMVVILLLIAGGVFWWWQKREIKGSPKDYVVKETEEGIIIENKRAGLTMKAPDGWIVEKIEIMEGSVVFYTPDIESVRANKKDTLPLKTGCMVEVAVDYMKTTLEEIEKIAQEEHETLIMRSDEFEMTEISGRAALRNTFNCVELGPSIEVYVPKRDILYGIRIAMEGENTERCSQEFDKFLETVSIK